MKAREPGNMEKNYMKKSGTSFPQSSLFLNRRLLVTLLMGFASGLPIALCSSTLQAWYTVADISIITIGILSLVGQPYVYKFLWSPILDRFVPPFLGRRRGWILLMQIALVITLIIMAFLNPQTHTVLLGVIALIAAFFSATQDIGIDAYRTDLLKPDERGLGAAMVTIGYRVALIISGGLAMVIAAKWGWRTTYLLMAILMGFEIIVTFWSPEPEFQAKAPTNIIKAVVEPFKEFMSREAAVGILLLIIIYKLTDAFAVSLGTTFLIRGVGFNLATVGMVYKMVGMAASVSGALVGGFIMVRLGMYRSLMSFGILQGASNLMYMLLAMVGKNIAMLVGAVFLENFCGGLATVAFVAFLMSLCDSRYTATQFALLSALSSIGRVFVGPAAAFMVKDLGWVQFYFWTAMIALPSLILLWFMRARVDAYIPVVIAKTDQAV